MRKNFKRLMSSLVIVMMLCVIVMPTFASAATIEDVGGLLVVRDSSGEIVSAMDGILVFTDDAYFVFTTPDITDQYQCSFLLFSTEKEVPLSFVKSYDYFSVFQVTGKSDLPSVNLGEWNNESSVLAVYCDGNSMQITSQKITVADEKNGVLKFTGDSINATIGAAIISPSTGNYVGMLIPVSEEASNDYPGIYGITSNYIVSTIRDDNTGSGESGGEQSGDNGNIPAGSSDTGTTGSTADAGSNGGGNVFTTTGVVLILGIAGLFIFLFFKNKNSKVNQNTGNAVNIDSGSMAGRICIIGEGGGYFSGRKLEIDGSVTIGRQAERCNICYPQDTKGVSGLHCQLRQIGNQLEIIDLGSSYGTYVNGQMIAPNTPVLMNYGDRFWLAKETNTFVVYR